MGKGKKAFRVISGLFALIASAAIIGISVWVTVTSGSLHAAIMEVGGLIFIALIMYAAQLLVAAIVLIMSFMLMANKKPKGTAIFSLLLLLVLCGCQIFVGFGESLALTLPAFGDLPILSVVIVLGDFAVGLPEIILAGICLLDVIFIIIYLALKGVPAEYQAYAQQGFYPQDGYAAQNYYSPQQLGQYPMQQTGQYPPQGMYPTQGYMMPPQGYYLVPIYFPPQGFVQPGQYPPQGQNPQGQMPPRIYPPSGT